MPVISPDAFAPPPANDMAVPVAAALREKVRRLERAYSAQRAGQEAVPLAHGHLSENVVMVMVWLCSSHRASGVNGEISP